MNQNRNAGYDLSANGNLSPYKLSQLWGAVHQADPFALRTFADPFADPFASARKTTRTCWMPPRSICISSCLS